MHQKQECPYYISIDWLCKVTVVDTREWRCFTVLTTNHNWLRAAIV
jgi:hypothetical protein